MTGSERQMPADSITVRQRSGEESNSDAPPGMIDPVTIQRAYATNVDALKVMALFCQLNRQLPKG
jgi:flagellar basal body rod protein FlgG